MRVAVVDWVASGSVRHLSGNLPPSPPAHGFTADACACSDPKKPPEDSERRERMGTCNRKRLLEAMAWEHPAGESLRAHRTLCEPRPNA